MSGFLDPQTDGYRDRTGRHLGLNTITKEYDKGDGYKMLNELDSYDWAEVFGEGSGGNCTAIIPATYPTSKTPTHTFNREDVAKIEGIVEGENDGSDWVVWGCLRDGRWFVARGGCDYTGWDCRAGNSGDVADTREEIMRFGLTLNERERFGIVLPEVATP